MRTVKLQMQVSLDGFVAGPNGEMDWMVWDWDEELKQYINKINDPVDCILLGRVLAQGFIPTWASRLENPETADAFAQKMNDLPKIVFSKTLHETEWENTRLVENSAEEINRLKQQPGNDIMLYGGATLTSSFIQHGLIDEFYLFVNPVALGSGLPIFKGLESKLKLKLIESRSFSCGIVALFYKPNRD